MKGSIRELPRAQKSSPSGVQTLQPRGAALGVLGAAAAAIAGWAFAAWGDGDRQAPAAAGAIGLVFTLAWIAAAAGPRRTIVLAGAGAIAIASGWAVVGNRAVALAGAGGFLVTFAAARAGLRAAPLLRRHGPTALLAVTGMGAASIAGTAVATGHEVAVIAGGAALLVLTASLGSVTLAFTAAGAATSAIGGLLAAARPSSLPFFAAACVVAGLVLAIASDFVRARTATRGAAVGLAAALAAGAAAGLATGELVVVAIIAAVTGWTALAWRLGPVAAAVAVVSIALPIYGTAWFGSLRAGVGLLTLLLTLLALVLLVRAPESVRAALGYRRTWLLAGFLAVVASSAVLAPRGAETLTLLKLYLARGFLLPVLLVAAVIALPRWQGVRLLTVIRLFLVAAAVIGAALSGLQMAAEIGYPSEGSFAIDQFVGRRAIGLSEAPGTWAAFLLIPLGLAGAAWVRGGAWPWGAALLAIGFALVLSGLRSAWGAAVVLAVAGLLVVRSRRAVAAFGVLAIAATATLGIANFRSSLAGGGEDGTIGIGEGRLRFDESAQQRLALTRAELALGLRHPWTGVGLGNLGHRLDEVDVDLTSTGGTVLVTPGVTIEKHNVYTGLFAELGAPGLVLFLAVLAATCAAFVRAHRSAADLDERTLVEGLFAGFIATIFIGVFTEVDRQVFLWWLVGVGFALDLVLRGREGARLNGHDVSIRATARGASPR